MKTIREICNDGRLSWEETLVAPNPETLPAGWYFERYNDGETLGDWDTFHHVNEFTRELNQQYCPFDPPPEVTGKPAPTCISCNDTKVVKVWPGAPGQGTPTEEPCSVCQPPQDCIPGVKPTFEEWCQANVVGWEIDSRSWYHTPVNKMRHLSIEVFRELTGYEYESSAMRSYDTASQARAALKAALLKLGRIRP